MAEWVTMRLQSSQETNKSAGNECFAQVLPNNNWRVTGKTSRRQPDKLGNFMEKVSSQKLNMNALPGTWYGAYHVIYSRAHTHTRSY